MWNFGSIMFPVLLTEQQYILLVIAFDQQHCSSPLLLSCENNLKTCCYFFSNSNYGTFTHNIVLNHIF